MNLRVISSVAASAIITAACLAGPTPVGKWTGHIHTKLAANATAQQKQYFEMGKKFTDSMKMSMTFKGDHTFSATVSMGAGSPGAGKEQKDGGTWSQSGNTVTLKDSKDPQGAHAQKFTLSRDGKTLSFSPPPTAGMSVEIVFTK